MSVYFDPDAPAKSTNTLQVEVVRRECNGEVIEVARWLESKTEGEVHAIRPRIRQNIEGEGFLCFCCGHPVLLKKHEHGGHYFAHKEKLAAEKSKCMYQQKQQLSLEDRDRIRYQGQREGARHIKTKKLIENIIRSDPLFSGIRVEETWTTFEDGWRKPDVAAKFEGLDIVFEAQVSNTYPQIVAERANFYRKQGALLIWVYDELDEAKWRTLHSDNFCANEQQLFFVDEKCVETSLKLKSAHFKIYSQRPDVRPTRFSEKDKWGLGVYQKDNCVIYPFKMLSFDFWQQKAFYFEVGEEIRIAQHKIACAQVQMGESPEALEKSIQEFIGSTRPIDWRNVAGWAALVCAVESKRLGKAIGTRLSNPVSVLNLVYDHHPNFIGHLIQVLNILGLDCPAERTGAWKSRVESFEAGRYGNMAFPESHKGSGKLIKRIYRRVGE